MYIDSSGVYSYSVIIVVERWQRLTGAYSQAMAALREDKSRSIAVEQRCKFGGKRHNISATSFRQPKYPNLNSWTHKFFCLAETEESRVPSTRFQRNELVLAGLDESRLTVPDVNCSPQEFWEILLTELPKLCMGGRFKLLKCTLINRQLELILFSFSNSQVLKSWIGTARIYLRPI